MKNPDFLILKVRITILDIKLPDPLLEWVKDVLSEQSLPKRKKDD